MTHDTLLVCLQHCMSLHVTLTSAVNNGAKPTQCVITADCLTRCQWHTFEVAIIVIFRMCLCIVPDCAGAGCWMTNNSVLKLGDIWSRSRGRVRGDTARHSPAHTGVNQYTSAICSLYSQIVKCQFLPSRGRNIGCGTRILDWKNVTIQYMIHHVTTQLKSPLSWKSLFL